MRRSRRLVSRLTSNGGTACRVDLATGLKLQGNSTLGGGLPAQISGSTSLEAVASRRVVERVGSLSCSKSREGSESEVNDGAHGGLMWKDRTSGYYRINGVDTSWIRAKNESMRLKEWGWMQKREEEEEQKKRR